MGRPRGRSIRRFGHYRNWIRLADSLIRYLFITRRRVARDGVPDYARLWNDVRIAAQSAGARAWVFSAEGSSGLFTEFIEWQGVSVLDNELLASTLDALNSKFFPGENGIWQEAQI